MGMCGNNAKACSLDSIPESFISQFDESDDCLAEIAQWGDGKVGSLPGNGT